MAVSTVAGPAGALEAGDLDPSFGSGGTVEVPMPDGSAFEPGDHAVAADGSIVVAGRAGTRPVVARFTAHGALDESFGDGGIRVLGFDGRARGVGALPGGDVVVGGDGTDGVWVARLGSTEWGPVAVAPGAARGGTLAVTGGSTGVLVAAANGTSAIALRRYAASTGALDTAFGSGGVARADFGGSKVATVSDLSLSGDGAWVTAAGHLAFNGKSQAAAARLATATGALDPAFGGGTGMVTSALGTGADVVVRGVAADATGRTIVAGNRTAGPRAAVVVRLDAAGSREPAYAPDLTAAASSTTGVAVDGTGRALVAATGAGSEQLTLVRLTDGGTPDATFAGDGVARAPACGTGTARSVALQGVKPVVLGSCDGMLRLARFHDDAGVEGIASLDLAVTPAADLEARALDLRLEDITPEQRAALLQSPGALAALQASPLRNSPLRNSPLRNSPLRNSDIESSPLRNSPLRNSPLRNSPLRSSSLPPILLSSIPLLTPGGWQEVLDGITDPAYLTGAQPHTVTLQELPDSALAGITLDMLDLSASPLRNSGLAAVLFGATPLAGLPAPAGGWCALRGAACPDDPSFLAGTTLFDLELAGVDLAPYLATPIDLLGTALHPDSPLARILLADLELADTPIGAVTFAQAPSLFEGGSGCGACAGATLAVAQEAFPDAVDVSATADVGDLLADPPPGLQLTFGQLLVGLVRVEDLPYELLPFEDLLALAPEDLVGYRTTFDVACADSADLTVALDLPAGFDAVEDGVDWRLAGDGAGRTPAAVDVDGTAVEVLLQEGPICSSASASVTVDVPVRAPSTHLSLTRADVTVTSSTAGPEHASAELRYVDGGGAPATVEQDVLYTGHIGESGEVDLYELPAPAEGSTVAVILSHLPADYDLVLYGDDAPEAAPLRNSPLRNSPLRNSPLRNSAVDDPGVDVSGGNELPPETLQDIPLRNSPLRNSSTQRDLAVERVTTLVTGADQGHRFTIQVSGYNGATSPDPYVLRVKVTPPLPDLECRAPARGAGAAGSLPDAVPPGTRTLFLVNQQRLTETYGDTSEGTGSGEAVVARLQQLAGRAEVQGVVVPVEGSAAVAAAYAAWDADPCSVDRANDVVGAINHLVDGYRASLGELRHVVLVGSDDIVPMARITDLTQLANQRDYRSDAAIGGVDNPISRAFARGYLLSDDPYGDFDPAPWLNGQLYLPDVGLGRLVETPGEILAAVDRYVASGGVLDVSTSYTTGYDFLADGAAEVDASLRALGGGGPASRIDEEWTRQDVIDAWQATPAPKAISVNAHYDHYRALPALGNAQAGGTPELLTTGDLTLPLGALLFSMGCQGGLNIPDVFASVGSLDERFLDWPQAVVQQAGVLAANTGYGYGDTEVVAYSERLYAGFAAGLDGSRTVGQALALAKHGYISGLGVAGVYDAKASQESVFYGLPFYRLGTGGQQAPSLMPPVEAGGFAAASTGFEVSSFDEVVDPQPVHTDRGTYYQVGDTPPQVTHYRPIVPRHEVPVAPVGTTRAHGVVLEGLRSRDISPIDPVYAVPVRDDGESEPEPSIDSGIFPSTVHNLTWTATPDGRRDLLVLLPGQVFTESATSATQRLFTRMAGKVLHSSSDDFEPPTIERVETARIDVGGQARAMFSTVVPDPDVVRVVALFTDDGSSANADGSVDWRRVELGRSGDSWVGLATLSSGAAVTQWLVQAVDSSGNVATSTNKARYFDLLDDTGTGSDGIAVDVSPAPSTSGFYLPGVTVTAEAESGATVEHSIDGGPYLAGGGPIVLVDDGIHTIRFRAADGSSAVVVVPVAEVVVEVDVPAEGQQIEVGAHVEPVFRCLGSSTSCTADPEGPLDTSPGVHELVVTATASSGRVVTVVRTYVVSYRFEGFFTPPDGEGLNRAKAGSNVPVKFRLHGADGPETSPDAVTRITVSRIDCTTRSHLGVTASGPPDGAVKWADDQLFLGWRTESAWAGTCQRLTLTFADGLSRSILFQLS